jgi:hypothetical protein
VTPALRLVGRGKKTRDPCSRSGSAGSAGCPSP